MTTRLTLNSPLLVGFEQIERTLDRLAKSTNDSYPPYNLEQTSELGLHITLAVAGFCSADLAIQVEGNQLTIRGKTNAGAQKDDGSPRLFLHRGIAARQFQKCFLLGEGLQVGRALLDNGLLHIELSRPAPQAEIRRIEIAAGKPATDQDRLIRVDTDAVSKTDTKIGEV